MMDSTHEKPKPPLTVTVNGKPQVLTGAAAELARRVFKFALYMSDEDFTGTFVYKINRGQLVESKFEVTTA
jgi:hypothetical protein